MKKQTSYTLLFIFMITFWFITGIFIGTFILSPKDCNQIDLPKAELTEYIWFNDSKGNTF